ncbi:MAG: hypothetical protein A3B68_06165 [Candidatus Melainabacteria bacterium RIFCSPHIGHO2_02_FULL_34_12]|nr:MAG: hypothetical protein A3B68_06165 [Candidatus Melainabacteria bacterium RIFCSPHIGHO2_02_FULL_34_12]
MKSVTRIGEVSDRQIARFKAHLERGPKIDRGLSGIKGFSFSDIPDEDRVAIPLIPRPGATFVLKKN